MAKSVTGQSPFLTHNETFLRDLPAYLRLPWQQAQIAVQCLNEKLLKLEALKQGSPKDASSQDEARPKASDELVGEMAHPVLPYLIHASVLFFLIRDLLAFEVIRSQEAFKQSPLPQKLRQVPSYQQLMALLNSVAKTQPLLALIQPISNNVLPIEHLQVFRNAVIQHGIPSDCSQQTAISRVENAAGSSLAGHEHPFPLPPVDYLALSRQLLEAWAQMNQWLSDKKPFGAR